MDALTVGITIIAIFSAIITFILDAIEKLGSEKGKARSVRQKIVKSFCVLLALILGVITVILQTRKDFIKDEQSKKDVQQTLAGIKKTQERQDETIDSIKVVLNKQDEQLGIETRSVDSVHTLLVGQKSELNTLLNIHDRVDPSSDIHLEADVEFADTTDESELFDLLNERKDFLINASKRKFQTTISDDYASSDTFTNGLMDDLKHFVYKKTDPKIEIYFLPQNVSTRATVKTIRKLKRWDYYEMFNPGVFLRESDSFIPHQFKLSTEYQTEEGTFDFNIRDGNQSKSKTFEVKLNKKIAVQPLNVFPNYQSFRNKFVIVKVSANTIGMKLTWLRLTNKLTNYTYSIKLQPLIRSRNKEFLPDFGWAYCAENYYLAQIGSLENQHLF